MARKSLADTLRPDQWHLNNIGQTGGTPGIDINVLPVWEDYRGEGIRVAVLDSGVDTTHPDLVGNYLSEFGYDFGSEVPDGSYLTQDVFDPHGTFVSGLIAGTAQGTGIRGVAFESKFTSYADFNGAQAHTSFARAADAGFDVMNNSWGAILPFSLTFRVNPALGESIEYAVSTGRDGLGLNIVFAAGNSYGRNRIFEELGFVWSGELGIADTNTDSLQNSRFTITVGALDHDGTYSDGLDDLGYTTPGASVLVSAPGTAVASTDIQGDRGYNPGEDFAVDSGTSFAAPVVSGVVALMLEANPLLGYRDVKEILAYSARWNDQDEPAWSFNGAINHNGGGLLSNYNYGFGLVDATAAVRLAETWHKQSTFANEVMVKAEPMVVSTAIPDGDVIEFQFTLEAGVSIETVELDFGLDHEEVGDLIVSLISPSGMSSTLLARLFDGRATEVMHALIEREGIEADPAKIAHTLSSNEFWGEDSGGVWTVVVEDARIGNVGSIDHLALRAYGAEASEDTTYIFTNDYATIAELDPARQHISNANGTHSLNFAAVSTGIVLDLAQRQGTIAGTDLTIGADTGVNRVFSGDGNDTITLSAAGGTVFTGRGNDTIELLGQGTVDGGTGVDRVLLSQNRADYEIAVSDGTVTLSPADQGGGVIASNVQYFSFAQGADILVAAANAFEARVASFYETLLGRAADFEGLAYWFGALDDGIDAGEIASSFAASTEFALGHAVLADRDYLGMLYTQVLGREADTSGLDYWAGELISGISRSEIAASFAMSNEAANQSYDSILLV